MSTRNTANKTNNEAKAARNFLSSSHFPRNAQGSRRISTGVSTPSKYCALSSCPEKKIRSGKAAICQGVSPKSNSRLANSATPAKLAASSDNAAAPLLSANKLPKNGKNGLPVCQPFLSSQGKNGAIAS